MGEWVGLGLTLSVLWPGVAVHGFGRHGLHEVRIEGLHGVGMERSRSLRPCLTPPRSEIFHPPLLRTQTLPKPLPWTRSSDSVNSYSPRCYTPTALTSALGSKVNLKL